MSSALDECVTRDTTVGMMHPREGDARGVLAHPLDLAHPLVRTCVLAQPLVRTCVSFVYPCFFVCASACVSHHACR